MNTDMKNDEKVYCVVIDEETFKEVEKIQLDTDLPISYLIKVLLHEGMEAFITHYYFFGM